MSTTADQPQRKLLLADANIFIDLVQAGGLGLIGDIVRFGNILAKKDQFKNLCLK